MKVSPKVSSGMIATAYLTGEMQGGKLDSTAAGEGIFEREWGFQLLLKATITLRLNIFNSGSVLYLVARLTGEFIR